MTADEQPPPPPSPRSAAPEDGPPAASGPLGAPSSPSNAHQPRPAPQDADADADAGPLPPGESLSGGKRKRVVLSIHEKQQVLQRLALGEPPSVIARAFGISRQQVSDIKKNRERILAFCVDATHLSSLQRKTLRAAAEFHPGVEQELYRWLVRQRRLQRAVGPDALAAKAAELFQQYAAASSSGVGVGAGAGGGRAPLRNVASWLRHFKRAHGLKALSEDEIEQLPDTFTPAMEMTPAVVNDHQAAATGTATATTSSSSSALGFGLAHSPAALSMDDVSTFMAAPASAYHPLPPQQATSAAGVAAVAEGFEHLSAQVGAFERAMTLKLDFLDARVEKLCFSVLPTRFS